MQIKKIAFAASLICLATSAANAQTKAPEPDYTLSYNIGAVTDYRYRGVSQSAKKPAIQGGVDYVAKSGVYLGAWASNITWIKDSAPGLKGPVEIDLYGGYKGDLTKAVSYDLGALQYWYPTNNFSNFGVNANTLEVYGAVTFGGLVTAKYSHSVTELFGTPNSKESGYLDLSATFDLGNSWSVTPHMGVQRIKTAIDYTDYSLAVNKDIDGLVLGATLVGTDRKGTFVLPGSGTKDLGNRGLVLSIKKNF
jgi:uncharacterized protein (TIGR02001 family)